MGDRPEADRSRRTPYIRCQSPLLTRLAVEKVVLQGTGQARRGPTTGPDKRDPATVAEVYRFDLLVGQSPA